MTVCLLLSKEVSLENLRFVLYCLHTFLKAFFFIFYVFSSIHVKLSIDFNQASDLHRPRRPVGQSMTRSTISATVLRLWVKTYSCYGSRVTSPTDSVLSLTRTAHARFLSDTTHCPMVTSKPVCRTTVPDNGLPIARLPHTGDG